MGVEDTAGEGVVGATWVVRVVGVVVRGRRTFDELPHQATTKEK